MLHNLPLLQDTQTLYSWCGLVHALNGGRSAIATSRELFGAPYAALCHDFPSHLATFDHQTNRLFGDTRRLALSHTLLGYFLPTAPESLAGSILSLVSSGALPQLKMQLGITASRVGGHHPLKGCRECFDEDEQSHGSAFWHVDHQYPSVFVCTRHRRPLITAWDPVTPIHRRGWLLPKSGPNRDWREFKVPHETGMNCLMRLAEHSTEFARVPPSSLDPHALARVYQGALRNLGIATAKGNLKLKPLVATVRSQYQGLDHLPGLGALRSIDPGLPGLAASLSRRAPRSGHPLKHLLLITTLFDTWEQFLAGRASTSCAQPVLDDINHAPAANEKALMFERMVRSNGSSITSASRAVGVSTTTGIQWARKLGMTFTSRSKRINERDQEEIIAMLCRGDSIASIADATGTSETTVNRVLGASLIAQRKRRSAQLMSRRTIARRSFLSICTKQSNTPMTAIRSVVGNSYMWLYRNDREWLLSTLLKLGRLPRVRHQAIH